MHAGVHVFGYDVDPHPAPYVTANAPHVTAVHVYVPLHIAFVWQDSAPVEGV